MTRTALADSSSRNIAPILERAPMPSSLPHFFDPCHRAHLTRSSALKRHRWLQISLSLGLLVLSLRPARAQPSGWTEQPPAPPRAGSAASTPRTVWLWGVQSGCTLPEQLNKNLGDSLKARGFDVRFLRGPAGQPLPACPGKPLEGGRGCMDALRAQCSLAMYGGPTTPGKEGSAGYVLGGLFESDKPLKRTRLWLYDLASGRRALRDDYCQQCNPDVDPLLADRAVALIQNPLWDMAASDQPLYCQERAAAPPPVRPGSLHLGIFGAFPGLEELRRELATRIARKRSLLGGEPPLLIPDAQRGSDTDTLERLTGKRPGAQVLLIERTPQGKVTLTLWDQSTRRPSTPRILSCPTNCLEPLAEAAAVLQDLCFESGCANKQPKDLRPAGDCEPFSGPVCEELPSAGAERLQQHGAIDPGRAKTLLALTGVGVGLSVAATLGLWITDRTAVVTYRPEGAGGTLRVDYPYTPVAITATVVSAALLGVSIPAFYWLGQAAAASPGSGKAADSSAVPPGPSPPGAVEPSGLLQCPAGRVDVAKKTPPGSRTPG